MIPYLDDLVASDVKNAQLLVTAGGSNQGAVVVPGNALNDLHMSSNLLLLDSLLDIPELHGQISRGRQEDVLSNGVEEDLSDLATVRVEADDRLNVDLANLVRDRVEENLAVLCSRGNQVVVEGRKVGVKNSSRVTAVQGKSIRDFAYQNLIVRKKC